MGGERIIGREEYNSLRYGDIFLIDWDSFSSKVRASTDSRVMKILKNGTHMCFGFDTACTYGCNIHRNLNCPGSIKIENVEESFCISYLGGNTPIVRKLHNTLIVFTKEDFLL